jgi:hypothetical protein
MCGGMYFVKNGAFAPFLNSIPSVHQRSTYFYKVAPGLVERHSLRLISFQPSCLSSAGKIQIVGLVARNLDYVLIANSKVAFGVCTIQNLNRLLVRHYQFYVQLGRIRLE